MRALALAQRGPRPPFGAGEVVQAITSRPASSSELGCRVAAILDGDLGAVRAYERAPRGISAPGQRGGPGQVPTATSSRGWLMSCSRRAEPHRAIIGRGHGIEEGLADDGWPSASLRTEELLRRRNSENDCVPIMQDVAAVGAPAPPAGGKRSSLLRSAPWWRIRWWHRARVTCVKPGGAGPDRRAQRADSRRAPRRRVRRPCAACQPSSSQRPRRRRPGDRLGFPASRSLSADIEAVEPLGRRSRRCGSRGRARRRRSSSRSGLGIEHENRVSPLHARSRAARKRSSLSRSTFSAWIWLWPVRRETQGALEIAGASWPGASSAR